VNPPLPNISKPAAVQKIPKRARTKKKLITAARDLVYNKGAESIAIQEVTEAAGLATGSFYNYFNNKRDMLNAVIEDFQSVFEAMLEPTRSRLRDPAMRLAITLKYYFQQSQDNEAWRSFIINAGLSDEVVLVQSQAQCLADILAGLRGGRFKTEDPAITQSLITGMASHVCLEIQRGHLPKSAVNETVRHVLRMLGLPDIAAKAFADAPLPEIESPVRSDLPADPSIPYRVVVERRKATREASSFAS
jgi:AcrR family transcriptional regulator